MALMDAKLELSDAQTLALGAGDHDSEDELDFTDPTQKPGIGTALYLNVVVNTKFVGAAATLAVKVADTADSVFYQTPAIAVGTLVAGYRIIGMSIPHDTLQTLKVTYTITGTFTEGKVDAWVDLAPQT